MDRYRELWGRFGHSRDYEQHVAAALGLRTFSASGRTFYRRLALVAEGGLIVVLFDPVAAPEENAAEVAGWLEARARERTKR